MLDKLKIISSDQIMTFECPAYERIIKKADDIDKNGKLENPMLVQPIGDRYLLLDDTSILAALQRLKITHIPIQLANPKLVTLHPWQRISENWNKSDLLAFCRAFPRQLHLRENSKESLSPREAEIKFRDEGSCRLFFNSELLEIRADLCIKLLAGIERSFRAKLNYNDRNPLADFPQASAAIYPPIFTLEELGRLADRGIQLPHGLVRIDQPGRILGLDYSLSILRESVSIEEKESFLRQMIRMRMVSGRVAYYDGYVLMFNN